MGKPSGVSTQKGWFCVDYGKVNAVTKKDTYPLPRVDNILDTLGKAKYFSTLGLATGYLQIEMDPATREICIYYSLWFI